MSAKPIWVYYDVTSDQPVLGKGCLRYGQPAVYKRDVYELRLQAVNTPNFTPRLDGTVPTHIQSSLSGFSTNALFGIKTANQYTDGDVFTQSWQGYDTGSTWHILASGQAAIPFVIPAAVVPGEFVASAVLINSTGGRWHCGRLLPNLLIVQDVYTGTESNQPSGITGAQYGDFSITGIATTTVLTISGMTATGRIIIMPGTPTGGAGDTFFYPDYSVSGQVTISVTSAPGTGASFNGSWVLQRLS